MKRRLAALAIGAALTAAQALVLGGCAYAPKPAVMTKLPVYPLRTASETLLSELPAPEHPVAVAVYGFGDQTGQFKQSPTGQTLSRAISQGGGSMLLRSLEGAGNRGWFTIVEREQLKDLLNERQIIRDQRAQYLGEKTVNPQALPALLFAGVLLEGGVVGYDTNTVTGGVGATLLGIGGDAKYQQDTVTVYLRAVSVKTGEVLTSVTASKTITSFAVDANVFRYISSTSLLETENGFTTNEPAMLALQQAIDKAVYGLVMQGVELHLWNFADPKAAWPALWRYEQERDGRLTAAEVASAESRSHHTGGEGPISADRPPPPPDAPPPSAALRHPPEPDAAPARLGLNTDPIGEDHIGDLLAAADSSPGPTGPGDREARLAPAPTQ